MLEHVSQKHCLRRTIEPSDRALETIRFKNTALEILGAVPSDVLNHNIETVPRLTRDKSEEPGLIDLGLGAGGALEHLKHLLMAVAVKQIDDATWKQQAHSRSRPTRVFDRISRHEVRGGKRRLSLASNAAPTSNLPLWPQQICPAPA
jgi:hypothetical protein